jgi:beta-lactam-binding protein with PASTA domain
MAFSDQLTGTLFDGRYKILKKIGAGGMADVYCAEDQTLGRQVAIKILNDRHAGDEQFVERFRREAQNAAGLNHPNIVSIYDRGEAEGTYYIAMEFLDGRSLKELIVARGPSPIPVAIGYARQVLAALRFSHRNGIVHRDIKPHNVIVDAEGRIKVTDFGIARAGAASQMTEAGSIIGTAQYLSPEQARGAPVDQTSDLYSVGVLLYELLTGTVPFTGDTPVEIAMKHLSQIPEPPSVKRPEVPADLDAIVLRALAKEPHDRYGSAEEMDADLARIAKGMAIADETHEAATQVLAGAGLMAAAPTTISRAPTMVTPPPPVSGVYYDYDYEDPGRSIWPWLFVLGLVIAATVVGIIAYQKFESTVSSTSVAVPSVTGIRATLAEDKLQSKGLVDHETTQPDSVVERGFVISQSPPAGNHVHKGDTVELVVSTGKPQVEVPQVIGFTQDAALTALNAANLKPVPHDVPSTKPVGTVVAQDPKSGTKVAEGSEVRINVSSGPTTIDVPDETGQSYDAAASELSNAGFKPQRVDVESNEPPDTVVDQSPTGQAAKGSTITLKVSKGPTTTAVPDETGNDVGTAKADLQNAGFHVKVVQQTTTDEAQDGTVLRQSPSGGADAKPGDTVTLTVGKYVAPTTAAATTTAADTSTDTTTDFTP